MAPDSGKRLPVTKRVLLARHIEDDLRRRIAVGDLGLGQSLPSRRDLAEQYGVALGTLQRAVASLLAEGVLSADARRGTFVAGQPSASTAGPKVARLGVVALYQPEDGTDEDNWGYWTLKAFEREASDLGAVISTVDAQPADPSQAVRDAVEAGAGALLLLVLKHPCRDAPVLAALAEAERAGLPVVMVSDRRGPLPVTRLRVDEWHGGYLAAQHLLAAGYEQVAFLSAHTDSWTTERAAGAVAALEVLSPGQPLHMRWASSQPLSAYLALSPEQRAACWRKLIVGLPSSGALGLVCPTDSEAALAAAVCREGGWVVGRQVGIVGYDNSPLARAAGLTSMRQPIEELGETAARLLQRALAGERLPSEMPLPFHLVARQSTDRRGD
ncbi:MAG: substrate-binding domain-containing protein [Armatimonadetes bacterium]|nr:substrate-binding domain-containing protein [Armatimonadota bacterium]